jgi:hypothetical protein
MLRPFCVGVEFSPSKTYALTSLQSYFNVLLLVLVGVTYRRCHLSGSTASECLTIYDNTLLMALQMTFRGAPCPSLWGFISDT